jgi:hypothetical protein
MKRSTPRFLGLSILTLSALLSGCVERQLTVTSEPPNALVYVNGKELGRTPIETDFLWYGNYDVQVRKEGFETLKTESQVTAPWWQWVPLDLIAELMPWHPTDRKSLHYTLSESPPLDSPAEALIGRANELKLQIESPPAR